MRLGLALALAVLGGGSTALAQPAGRPPEPAAALKKKLLLAPLSTLGSESKAADVKRTEKALVAGFAALTEVELIKPAVAAEAIKQARRPELKACDGDPDCLAEIGALVGAAQVVAGELGGLGDAQVVYLKLVDVATGTEVRSTTLELEATGGDAAARGVATQLVAPGRYVGTLAVEVSVPGATIFVDGEKLASSPARPRALAVGQHALRVTHPEYRDFVRFVEVRFGETTAQPVALERYGVVDRELAREGGGAPAGAPVIVRVVPAPWYRRWYTIAGGGALVFIGSALIVGAVADGIDADDRRDVE